MKSQITLKTDHFNKDLSTVCKKISHSSGELMLKANGRLLCCPLLLAWVFVHGVVKFSNTFVSDRWLSYVFINMMYMYMHS